MGADGAAESESGEAHAAPAERYMRRQLRGGGEHQWHLLRERSGTAHGSPPAALLLVLEHAHDRVPCQGDHVPAERVHHLDDLPDEVVGHLVQTPQALGALLREGDAHLGEAGDVGQHAGADQLGLALARLGPAVCAVAEGLVAEVLEQESGAVGERLQRGVSLVALLSRARPAPPRVAAPTSTCAAVSAEARRDVRCTRPG